MSKHHLLQFSQLTQLSNATVSISPELSRYYLLNRYDCSANNLKSSNFKPNYCKVCYSSLIPGKNSKVKISAKTKPNKNTVLNLQTNAPTKVNNGEKKLIQKKKKHSIGNKLQNFIEYKCEYCEQSCLLRGLTKSSKSELKFKFKNLKSTIKSEKDKLNSKPIKDQASKSKINASNPIKEPINNNTNSKAKKPIKKKTTTLKSLLAKKEDDSANNSSSNFSLDDFLSNL